jgi:hypothetical protein
VGVTDKLYKAGILKNLQITQHHFAATAEIGLKSIAAGYRIKEVPVSWINRTADMGSSSFRLLGVGPHYLRALRDVIWWMRNLKIAARQEDSRKCRRVAPAKSVHSSISGVHSPNGASARFESWLRSLQ